MKTTRILAVTVVFGLLTTGCTSVLSSTHEDQPTYKDQKQKQSDVTVEQKPKKEKSDNRPTLADTIKGTEEGVRIVTNPDDFLVLVNKRRSLPGHYVPNNLIIPDVPFFVKGDVLKKYMRKVPAAALEQLFAAAKKEGIKLYAVSGYRSYDRQQAIFAYNAQRYGEEEANQVSAHAGESEHQTGLTMDISSESFGNRLEQAFGETRAGKWVAEHASEHGFIIRYPKGKEEITGYSYEPWHLRYVGKKAAAYIAENDIALEQYFITTEEI